MSSDEDGDSRRLISTNAGGWRVSQACDRCRMKKIKCDGGTPCLKCSKIGLECTTSDKLSRRAFPKGYTVNLERRIRELEEENQQLKAQAGSGAKIGGTSMTLPKMEEHPDGALLDATVVNQKNTIHINNPIDQIFNLDKKGIIIGNDNLNFESQFNRLLINLNLPFLKITNSHNYLLDDPDSYLYHPSYSNYNEFHNKDLEVIYNPLTVNGSAQSADKLINEQLPRDVYDLFIKLINNFKKIFNSKKELDHQIVQFFLNYNSFIPIFDHTLFMERYDAFHTMYPFMFTYEDATINGFNLSSNDYHVVNEYLILVIQIYAMILVNDPSLNMNLLLNHAMPNYSFRFRKPGNESIIRSLYEFLPYLNVFHVSMDQLQTYLLFFYYSLLTNNKEKSLLLSSLINAFIGILGVNLNSKNLFFNDLSLSLQQRRDRVKVFWGFKVLLKCFNLKFGFKPTINTTVINPVTIDRYFKLTPEKLSTLINPESEGEVDPLFDTLLRPSVEFLNLMNIIIPSSFSPNYYQYLKQDRHENAQQKKNITTTDWILNDDDGDGNDGNLNYNFTQFLFIDKNLSNWRYSLKDIKINILPLHTSLGLPLLSSVDETSLYHRVSFDGDSSKSNFGLSDEGKINFANNGQPDVTTAAQLIRMQLNFHYLLIRSMNYLNFVIDRELTPNYYVKIANISREVLAYFILLFEHVGQSTSDVEAAAKFDNSVFTDNKKMGSAFSPQMGLDLDEDGFVINDFSVKRRKVTSAARGPGFQMKEIPVSPFNSILNGLSLTIINLKKSIVLQMLYLLICTLKVAKKGGAMSSDTLTVLTKSIQLFIKIFINYQPGANRAFKHKRINEDELFRKMMNDELKDEFLKDRRDESDDEDDGEMEIDWDDENMDEDLKYLKILKYVQYKTTVLYERGQAQRRLDAIQVTKLNLPDSNAPLQAAPSATSLLNANMVQLPPLMHPPPFGQLNSPPTFPTTTTPMFPRGISATSLAKYELFDSGVKVEEEEKLANDLMNMKNGHRGYGSGQWNYAPQESPSTEPGKY